MRKKRNAHIDIPTLSDFKTLAAVRGDACVSIYLPTSPHPNDAHANRIAFRDAAKDALAQLAEAGTDSAAGNRWTIA